MDLIESKDIVEQTDDILIYFYNSKASKYYRKIIKDEGGKICRDIFNQNIINDALQKFNHGFAFVSKKASIGRAKRGSIDNICVSSFVLFSISSKVPTAYVNLICVKGENKGQGNILMRYIFDYINKYNQKEKNETITEITLHAMPESYLLQWYEKKGFEKIDTIYMQNKTKIKAYLMRKIIE
jgi:hypothetical protein